MTRPMIAHRSAAYEALHATIATGLQGAFGTSRPVWLLTMSATGATRTLSCVQRASGDVDVSLAPSAGVQSVVVELLIEDLVRS